MKPNRGILQRLAKLAKPPYLRQNNGFTLVELLIVMFMMTVVGGVFIAVTMRLTRSYTTQEVAAGIQQTARAGLEFMMRDLRLAGLDEGGSSGAGLVDTTASRCRFTIDRDGNGSIDTTNEEQITYFFDGSINALRYRLYEGTASQDTQTLIEDVSGLLFTYLDINGNPTANPNEIRSIVITLRVSEPAGRDGMIERTYTGRVRLRNIGI